MFAAGCRDDVARFNQPPDTEPVAATLNTAIPLAYAAAVAMDAAAGDVADNALSLDDCTGYPCSAVVNIDFDTDNAPFMVPVSGGVTVLGHFPSFDAGILATSFVNVSVGTENQAVFNVAAFPVTRTAFGITLVYAEVDINVELPVDPADFSEQEQHDALNRLNTPRPITPEVGIETHAWIVDVDFNDTPFDYSDDFFTISGGGQSFQLSADENAITQLAMVDVTVGPDCLSNPTTGLALLQDVNIDPVSFPIGQAILRFHSRCDGRVRVDLGSGSYFGATGHSFPIYPKP